MKKQWKENGRKIPKKNQDKIGIKDKSDNLNSKGSESLSKTTKSILDKNGIRLNKNLGQNYLIDKNKMDIYDINLSEITDQYIDFIKQMEEMNLEVTSEYLVMASELIHLKSKLY